MTEEQLSELLRLNHAATPGPWKVATWYGGYHTIRPKKEPEKSLGQIERKHDAAYIVAACNAVPELVSRIRELEEQLYEAVGCIITNESQTMLDCRICFFEQYCEYGKDHWKPDPEMCRKAIMKYVTPEETEENAGR